jgi:glycosyltransferase involved in cell wall biosynthesis
MKIALIGPGIMSIPPDGHGAVEILIWDYFLELTNQGHEVDIINKMRVMSQDQGEPTTPYCQSLIGEINKGNYDFVHLHYDCLYHILPFLTCKKVGITSHYPYIDQLDKHREDGYQNIFQFLVGNKQFYNFVLADKDYQTFLNNGADPSKLKKIKNGIDSKLFMFSPVPANRNKTIYLGKVTDRKNQAKYQFIDDIDFIGNVADERFNQSLPNYKGHWSREKVYSNLTDYSNLLLLSNGEADPLVVKEALIAGLGVVLNKSSSENLDTSLDFITIIEDNKMNDLSYVKQKIEENREISLKKRREIRSYGITTFDIAKEVKTYIDFIV